MIRWFGSRAPKEVQRQNKPPESQTSVHTSLAFNVVYHQLRKDRKFHVLDLGSACKQNIDFFAQFPCKVYIEDLYDTLASFDYLSPEDGFSYERIFDYLLPYRNDTHFDLILAWDLFNYLDREQFHHLVRHLRKFSRKGTVIFSLISTLKHLPEKPIQFRILDSERLLYETRSTVLRACPRYQQTDLDHILNGFRTCNSFLLRNGFKEYLFLSE